jgi:hypothetical protein
MNNPLKQSTTASVKLGPFMDNTGVLLTSLSIAQANILLSKNGGAFAQTHNSAGATYDAHGYYNIPLDATDANTLGLLRVMVDMSASGALAVHRDLTVLPAGVYDSLVAGTATLATTASSVTDKTGYSLTSAYDAAKTAAQPGDVPSTASIADAVWDEALSGHTTAGTAGKQLGDLSSGGGATVEEIWEYAGGRTITGGTITSAVQLAASQPNYAPAKAGNAMTLTSAYDAAKTAAQPGDVPTGNQIADAVLARDVASAEGSAPRTSLATTILAMTNKANTFDHAGYLTIYRTDGVTEHTRIHLSTNHDADPIDGVG